MARINLTDPEVATHVDDLRAKNKRLLILEHEYQNLWDNHAALCDHTMAGRLIEAQDMAEQFRFDNPKKD